MARSMLLLYIIMSCSHLYYSWLGNQRMRAKTKPFLLLFLALYYAFETEEISWFLLGAILFCWLGDVLLIPKGHKWFAMGGIAFGIGHGLLVLTYVSQVDFALVQWPIVPLAVLLGGIALLIVRLVRETTPKYMIGPMYFYLLANGTMNLFACMQFMTDPCIGTAVAFAGAMLFYISDCTLYLVRYYGNPKVVPGGHFLVMLTYLFGEFFIVQGMLWIEGMK